MQEQLPKHRWARAEEIGAVEEQHVEVHVQIQRRAEPLDQRHRAGGARRAREARLLKDMARDLPRTQRSCSAWRCWPATCRRGALRVSIRSPPFERSNVLLLPKPVRRFLRALSGRGQVAHVETIRDRLRRDSGL